MKRIICGLFHTERYFKKDHWPYYNTCVKCGLDWRLGTPCPPVNDGPVLTDALIEHERKQYEAAYDIVFGEYETP